MQNYSAYSDKELYHLIQLDDVLAFTGLYDRHWKRMFSAANNVLHNTEAAKDVVQDIFTSLWERRHEVAIEYPGSYLYQATRFQVFKAIRECKTDAGFYGRLANISATMVNENAFLFKELSQLFAKILEQLPEDHRKAFLLSRENGLTYVEIAGQMKISPKTVEKKISNTLKRIHLGFDRAFLLLSALLSATL